MLVSLFRCALTKANLTDLINVCRNGHVSIACQLLNVSP